MIYGEWFIIYTSEEGTITILSSFWIRPINLEIKWISNCIFWIVLRSLHDSFLFLKSHSTNSWEKKNSRYWTTTGIRILGIIITEMLCVKHIFLNNIIHVSHNFAISSYNFLIVHFSLTWLYHYVSWRSIFRLDTFFPFYSMWFLKKWVSLKRWGGRRECAPWVCSYMDVAMTSFLYTGCPSSQGRVSVWGNTVCS